MPEGVKVEKMFSEISGGYDRANHLLSGGIDFFWRYKLIKMVEALKPKNVLDLATGSGDVALALKKKLGPNVDVIGMDFCESMLDQARQKKLKYKITEAIQFRFGDCLDLALEDNSLDVVTIAFGLRNLENRHKGLCEMHRVLKKGSGVLFVLEFTQPAVWFKPFYYLYLKFILPILAKVVTRNMNAYDYLVGSIESFPTKNQLAQEIKSAGFSKVTSIGLTASIVAIHRCEL